MASTLNRGGLNLQDLVLIPNATTGTNIVIQSVCAALQQQPQQQQATGGSVVYMLDIGYGSVKKQLQAACLTCGASIVYGEVTFPTR